MKLNQNPLEKTIITQNNNFPFQYQVIDLSDIPDFIYPEKDPKSSELFTYLTQTINWPFYTLQDIYSMQQNKKNINFPEWQKEIEEIDKEKKLGIINSLNKSSKTLIELVEDYMKFINTYFSMNDEKVRTFIFLEYFLKKLEMDKYIINSDEYGKLYKRYLILCRDAKDIFKYLEKNKILIGNENFYFEKGLFFEKIHKYKEANQIYIEGFVNILDENNNNPQKGNLLLANYINFEKRMKERIERDLEGLSDELEEIDISMHNYIENCKIKYLNIKNINNNKKYFMNNNNNSDLTEEEEEEIKIIKKINYNFSIAEGRLNLLKNFGNSNGTEIVGESGEVKFIKNPPDINKVTSITSIYLILKKVLSLSYSDWKRDYENFEEEVQKYNETLPYSWISKLRPTKRNLKNMNDNSLVLSLIQKEYLNAGNTNSNVNINLNSDINMKNDINIKNENENKKFNNIIDNSFNEDLNDNKNNEHEISNMLSNLFFNDNKNEQQNDNFNNNQKATENNQFFGMNNQITENNINKENKIVEKDTNTILENIQYQIEHPPSNNNKDINQNNFKENNNNDNDKHINSKRKKHKKLKRNKFKHVGTLNFDQDGLMVINLSNENDRKIEIMQSASKLINNNIVQEKNEEKRYKKNYIIIQDNVPRRIKYIKNKTLNDKKIYEQKKREMLQGINFDYLNSFKKLFEIHPELNSLLENDQPVNQKNKIEEYKLDLQNEDNKNINLAGDVNIQRENGPSEAMRLLLEIYGIPKNFLEENNPYIEYAKKNGIVGDSMFENLFKEIKSYINSKSSKSNKNLSQSNKNNKKNNEDEGKSENINVDADGDLIIESESEEENNDNKNEKNSKNKDSKSKDSKNKDSKNKVSKHCAFDSKNNDQIIYYKEENNKENQDEVGKIIDDINKKAEKGIKIGEKTIFSNYKAVKEHSFNKNDNSNNNKINNEDIEMKVKIDNSNINNNNNANDCKNFIINKSIEISLNKVDINEKGKEKEKDKENKKEFEKNKYLITNSKLSTDIFMNALNFKNNHDNSKLKKNININNNIFTKPFFNSISNSISSDNYDNKYYSEAAYYSKSKSGKDNKQMNTSINDQSKVNNFKFQKEKGLSNIKENISIEKEKSSKIKNKQNINEKIEKDQNFQSSFFKNNYISIIGNANIHDLDNFDDLFK